MKKKWLTGHPYRDSLKKLMQIMRLTILLLFGCILTVSANSYAQKTKLDVNMSNASIRDLFGYIEEKSEFVFLYRNEDFNVNKKVAVNLKGATINQILDEALRGENVTYDVYERQVVIRKASDVMINSQQKKDISGTVRDGSGAPIPGVSIVVKGTSMGALTDVDGKFKLTIPGDAKTLVFSFVGMKTQEIAVGSQSQINVTLEEETVGIEEVVAVGYGTMRKSDFAGAASKIKVEGTEEKPYTSFDGVLQGKLAGVQITANTGTPGGEMTFNIRGATSTTGDNQPLIVVDGYPIETSNNMITAGSEGTITDLRGASGISGINPNDIESVEVLKDASATAIYGSRAANGVIMITTKRGKAGRDKVEYNVRFDFCAKPKDLGLLNTKEFMDLWNEAYRNTNPTATSPYFNSADYASNPDINWQDLVLQNSFGQTHSLNLSGGDPKMRYAIFGSYADLDGSVKYASNFKRGTTRLNFDREVSSHFKFGVSMAGEMIANQAVGQSNANGNVNGSIMNALLTAPLNSPYDANGDLQNLRGANGGGNPLTIIKNVKDLTKTYHFNVNGNATLTIIDGLTANTRIGIDYKRVQRNQYQPKDTRIGMAVNGYAYSGEGDMRNYLADFTLNYNKSIGKHRINSMVGFSHQEWQNRNYASVTTGFASDKLTYYAPQSSNKVQTPVGLFQESAMNSYLARIGYSYNDRYLLTLTGRSDGSTRLAIGHKWATFPSVGIGWNMHNEEFLKSQKIISQLKLHGSWGISGNQSVAIGASQPSYYYSKYSFNQTVSTGYILNSIGNPDLGWENTSQFDLGIESAYLDNRLTFNFDVYKKRTTSLLFNRAIPSYTGFGYLQTNGGEIENKGFEFELSAVILRNDLKWNVSANLSVNRNKVLDLGGVDTMYGPVFNAAMGKNQSWTIARIGQPIGVFYGYKIDGIYQTPEEVAAGPEDSNKTQGGWKFVDVSGPNGVKDNKITADDMTVIGNPYPKFTYGLTNDLSFKDFSLSVFIMGSQGNEILNMYRIQTDAFTVTTNPPNTTKYAYDHRWTGPGTSNDYPKPLFINNRFYQRPNNKIVEDGSYVKLKSVTLSYDLPVSKLKFIQKFRVFITGTNLLTITKYSGFDPEINSYGFNSMSQGLDLGSLPQVRSFSSGLIIGF